MIKSREFAEATKLANGTFQNHLHWNYSQTKFRDILKWQWNRSQTMKTNLPKSKSELEKALPVVKPNFQSVDLPSAKVTWLGHASVLLQVEKFAVLTDPVFSDRAGPFGLVGPKRFRPCPITVDSLPTISAIVISHNHYDHLDQSTISKLASKFPMAKWYVPMGNSHLLSNVDPLNIIELNWWQKAPLQEFEMICVPAMHWSKRGLFDTNKGLWAGWIVKGRGGSFYFAGDTGYCSVFEAIGERFGPLSISAIPIGAYEPRIIMKNQHVNRQDAIQIHKDTKSNHSLGIHWGTFVLTDEFYLEPKDLDTNELKAPFETVNHGESLVIKWA